MLDGGECERSSGSSSFAAGAEAFVELVGGAPAPFPVGAEPRRELLHLLELVQPRSKKYIRTSIAGVGLDKALQLLRRVAFLGAGDEHLIALYNESVERLARLEDGDGGLDGGRSGHLGETRGSRVPDGLEGGRVLVLGNWYWERRRATEGSLLGSLAFFVPALRNFFCPACQSRV